MSKIWLQSIERLPDEVILQLTAGAIEELELARCEGVDFDRDCQSKYIVWKDDEPLLAYGIHDGPYPEPWLLLCVEVLRSPFVWRKLKRSVWPRLQGNRTFRLRCGRDNEVLERFWRFFGFDIIRQADDLLVWEYRAWA